MHAETNIPALIKELQSDDAATRFHARYALVKCGHSIVPYVLPLLNSSAEQTRWEAAKIFTSVIDGRTAAALTDILTDESMEIRWLAAEALIELELHSIPPLLEKLEVEFDDPFVLEAAHHILFALKQKKLLSENLLAVFDSIRFLSPKTSVAIAARKALCEL